MINNNKGYFIILKKFIKTNIFIFWKEKNYTNFKINYLFVKILEKNANIFLKWYL